MEKEDVVTTNNSSKKKKLKSFEKRDRVYLGLFILIIVVAVILSLIISLLVFSFANSKSLSSDTGTIIVEVNPTLATQNGRIVVEVINSNSEKEVNSNAN